MESFVDQAIVEYILESPAQKDHIWENYTIYNITERTVTATGAIIPVVMVVIFLLGIVGNLTLMHVVARFESMRNPLYVYVTNIAVANFLALMASVSFSTLSWTLMDWPFGEVICKISKFLHTLSPAVTVFSLVAYSVDRYCSLACLYRCGGRSRTNTVVAIVLIWFLAISISLPDMMSSFIMVLPTTEPGRPLDICFPYPATWGKYYPKIQTLFKCSLIFAGPLCIILFVEGLLMMYICIKSKPQKQNSETDQDKKVNKKEDTIDPTIDDIYATPVKRKENSYSSDTDSEESDDSYIEKETKEEYMNNAKILLLLLAGYILCWVPHYTYLILFFYDRGELQGEVQRVLRVVSFCLTFLSTAINPYILCVADKSFRGCFGKSLSCCGQHRKKRKRRRRRHGNHAGNHDNHKRYRKMARGEIFREHSRHESDKTRRHRRPRSERRSRSRSYPLDVERYLSLHSMSAYDSYDMHKNSTPIHRTPAIDHQWSRDQSNIGLYEPDNRAHDRPSNLYGLNMSLGHSRGRGGRPQPVYNPAGQDEHTTGRPIFEDQSDIYKTIERLNRYRLPSSTSTTMTPIENTRENSPGDEDSDFTATKPSAYV